MPRHLGTFFLLGEVDRSKGRITLSGGLGGNLTLLVDDYMGLHRGIIMIIIFHSPPGTALPCSAVLQIVDPGVLEQLVLDAPALAKVSTRRMLRKSGTMPGLQLQNHCWL